MKMNYAIVAIGSTMAATLLSGCVITGNVREERRGYYGGPGPVIVTERPREVVVIHRPLPPPLVERPGPRPGPEVIWVPGYWSPRGDDWYWVSGHYERPPRSGAIWVEPRHERRGDRDVEFHLGFWR